MTLSIIVLAAGQGTRMKSNLPKVLHPLAGWPIVNHVLTTAQQLQPAHVLVVLGHDKERVEQALPPDVTSVTQSPQQGTGHAVLQTRPLLRGKSQTVLVLYGDTPLVRGATLRQMLDIHAQRDAAVSLLTFLPQNVTGYGRILRDDSGNVRGIVEQKDATPEQRAIQEANSGILCFRASWLWPHLDQLAPSAGGEYYLTDLVAIAAGEGEAIGSLVAEDATEVMGINDRCHLADAEAELQSRLNRELMLGGVTLRDPNTIYSEMGVRVGRDTVIEPNTFLRGNTTIGEQCVIGPNTLLQDATVENNCQIIASVVSAARIEENSKIGPFAHIR
ncbi:MAG: UDP-N-acetylglucosamine diphosphorylase/glucosamine-1-phosphate N-acetyltransferase [Chloroflexi bacterium]|nr:UDP-N-acetylglucosamine diphosphorylase/glucosamine-1-phosphate N-acetyltransferase [Chloroflexota bacterium]